MRLGLALGVFAIAVLVVSIPAHAEVVFSIAKVTPGPINKGADASFEVLARTTVGTQSFSRIAFDVLLSRGDGAGGIFTSHTSNIGGFGWFIELGGTKALFEGQSVVGFNSLSTVNRSIGTITLSTSSVSVLEGDYSITLPQIAADDGNASIQTSFAGPLSYSITSVPEPSTLILLSAVSMGAVAFRSRGRFSRSC